MKKKSVFFNSKIVHNVRENIAKYKWAEDIGVEVLRKAKVYEEKSYDELWDSVFGSTLPRAWHVWSNGHCPSCGNDVPMYSWKFDPISIPGRPCVPIVRSSFLKTIF